MLWKFLLIAGALTLSIGLRSFKYKFLKLLSSLGFLVVSFLTGWLITNSISLGLLLVISWFLFPWIEILIRVRRLRLPIVRQLRHQSPPNGPLSDSFEEVSNEIENNNFTHVTDTGWSWEDQQQFYRVFYREPSHTIASICVVKQSNIIFFYVCLRSQDAKGQVFITWNCPFTSGLKPSPHYRLNTVSETDLKTLEKKHSDFLRSNNVIPISISTQDSDVLTQDMQEDARVQILYNIKLGLLKKDGDDYFRYSFLGMFYLWWQAIKEMARL